MAQVDLIIDIAQEQDESRRATLTATLPGVPRAGDFVGVGRTLALKVLSVRWEPRTSSVMVFLTRGDHAPASIVDHGLGELELPDHYVQELREAGWTIED